MELRDKDGSLVWAGDEADLAFAMQGDEEITAAYELFKVQQAASEAKRTGKIYADTGVTVPFTSKDAIGVMQVKAAFEEGASSTVMHFSNGQKLPLTPETFPAFAQWFVTERNSFYQQ